MKILVVTQYYWPENSRVTDIAESLCEAGNEVTVLTGLPNYPQGFIYDGYKKGENRVQERNGVHIVRAKLVERRQNVIYRVLNYYSFPYYATKLVKKLPEGFDVILAMEESPIMLVKPAISYAKRYNKPLIMYEMDLWPESLLAGGIAKESLVYRHYKKVSAEIYSKFDKIVVSTKEHIPYIKNLSGCKELDIDYLAQYADTIFEDNNFGNKDNGVIDLMFAGNVGKAQSISTVIKAASILKDDRKFKFHIVGSGSELGSAKKIAGELKTDNVIFYGQRPLGEIPKLYKIADAMLVTLENKTYANITIPGKVQSYMAAGKPIIGAVNGSCANFIKNNAIGYVCNPEDAAALANLIKNLNLKELRRLGEHSMKVYFNKYSKTIFMDRLISVLKSMKR